MERFQSEIPQKRQLIAACGTPDRHTPPTHSRAYFWIAMWIGVCGKEELSLICSCGILSFLSHTHAHTRSRGKSIDEAVRERSRLTQW